MQEPVELLDVGGEHGGLERLLGVRHRLLVAAITQPASQAPGIGGVAQGSSRFRFG
jgi:hypothetical protein